MPIGARHRELEHVIGARVPGAAPSTVGRSAASRTATVACATALARARLGEPVARLDRASTAPLRESAADGVWRGPGAATTANDAPSSATRCDQTRRLTAASTTGCRDRRQPGDEHVLERRLHRAAPARSPAASRAAPP